MAGHTRPTSEKPERRPDIYSTVATPNYEVCVKSVVIPASGFYPCWAGMAGLPRVSCLHVFQTLWSVCFSSFAVS